MDEFFAFIPGVLGWISQQRKKYAPRVSELENIVQGWRSVTALSLNIGGGVRLINPAILYIHSALVISKSKGPSKTLRDQIFRIEENYKSNNQISKMNM